MTEHISLCEKCDRYFDVRCGCEADIRLDERFRVREEFLVEIGATWETLFTGTNYDAEMVQGIRTITLREALDRICPEEPA